MSVEEARFSAVIEQANGGGAYVRVPFDVEEVFGKKRVPVQATIDGEPYRGSLVRMGGSYHVLGVLKEIRTRAGKNIGDTVEITLAEDLAPRVVEVPSDIAEALAATPAAKAAFEALAYTHQREYVKWVDDAKRQATRTDRIARMLERLVGQESGADSASPVANAND